MKHIFPRLQLNSVTDGKILLILHHH